MAMVNSTFDQGRAEVREAAGVLRRDRASIDERVQGFLDAGWRGVAAEAFSEAWQDWLTAATDVEEGLAAMAELLDATQRDFNTQDDASQANLDKISARIVARLG
ncbi:MAG TPA: WXG100 family type VII secretion target [Nocardioides sp.]|nr:WXG100 family type VII secretion target [Nocardioides sp.]